MDNECKNALENKKMINPVLIFQGIINIILSN